MDVAPNQSPFPSQLPNSPFFAPFLRVPGGEMLDVQAVDEGTAIVDPYSHTTMPPQGPVNMLAEYRSKFPYVGIRPFPNYEKTVYLAAGIPKDIHIPHGVVTVTFFSSGLYFMSSKGNAVIPVNGDGDATMSVVSPNNIPYFVGNLRSVSVIAPGEGTFVSVVGYRFEEMPR